MARRRNGLHFAIPHNASQLAATPEQRRQPRIDVAFRTTVRGVDEQGHRFEEQTQLDNLSAGGLYLRLLHSVAPDARLFVAFRFAEESDAPALRVAVHGLVRRVERQADGRSGVALMFQHHRIV
jgi:PilZ domain